MNRRDFLIASSATIAATALLPAPAAAAAPAVEVIPDTLFVNASGSLGLRGPAFIWGDYGVTRRHAYLYHRPALSPYDLLDAVGYAEAKADLGVSPDTPDDDPALQAYLDTPCTRELGWFGRDMVEYWFERIHRTGAADLFDRAMSRLTDAERAEFETLGQVEREDHYEDDRFVSWESEDIEALLNVGAQAADHGHHADHGEHADRDAEHG